MSKIGKQPVLLPQGVDATVADGRVTVKGPLGISVVAISPLTTVGLQDRTLCVASASAVPQARANWGTLRALLANAVIGVSTGYKEKLIVEGIGFRAALEGKMLVLSVGFTHPLRFAIPPGITVTVEKNTMTISGIEKQQVSQVAAEIRSMKVPEPYKGTGIRYHDEVVRRKAGKKVAGAGVATT